VIGSGFTVAAPPDTVTLQGVRGRLEGIGLRGRIGLGENGCRWNEKGRQDSPAERVMADSGTPGLRRPRCLVSNRIDHSEGIRSGGPREGDLTPQRSSYECRRATLPSSR
jgi:hypothetical protein